MSRNTHVVIAAIAVVAAMLAFALPATVMATNNGPGLPGPDLGLEIDLFDTDQEQDFAQRLIDETEQDIEQDQEAEQEQTQEQEASNEADQSNEASVSQDETNDQSNVLVTGDNDATTTQSGSNTANENSAAAASEGGSGCCDDRKHTKKSSGGSGGGGDSEAIASVGIDQDVRNTAETVQDSSADNNVLSNENTFGNDVAVVDQDNLADQDAVNVGVQDQDLTQDQDATQEDLNFQYGFAQQSDEDALTVDISILEEVLGGND